MPSGYPVKPVSWQLTPSLGNGYTGRQTSRASLQGQVLELSPAPGRPYPHLLYRENANNRLPFRWRRRNLPGKPPLRRRHFTPPAALGGQSGPGLARAARGARERARPAGPGGGSGRAGRGEPGGERRGRTGAPVTWPGSGGHGTWPAPRLRSGARARFSLPFPLPLQSQSYSRSRYRRERPRPAPVAPAVTESTGARPRPFLRRLLSGPAGRCLNGGGGRGRWCRHGQRWGRR